MTEPQKKYQGLASLELIKALVECQKELTHAPKTGENPYFNSDYVTYEAVRDHVEPIYSS